ncbi:unnamed protein product [Agarophyton chilense]|eukprot:gb/GEZJ01000165.1/.p2 GENE.gb/GEZJ01000165.1/~~gb/GEZJ01000165.1/.p2  ORF type:complete len:413 (+),score=92.88 gb/GEZJ01000165.1/:5839-7077(+)
MSPVESFSSDEVDKLPSVPRIRRSSGAKPPVPRSSRSGSKSAKRGSSVAEKQPIRQSSRRRIGKKSPREEVFNSEDDGNDSSSVVVRRTSRRTQKTRKVIEDDDEDDEDGDHGGTMADNDSKDESSVKDENELNVEMSGEEEDDDPMDDDGSESKNASSFNSHVKRRKTIKESSSESKDDDGEDEGVDDSNDVNEDSNYFTNDSGDGEGNELIKEQRDMLAKLEAEVNNDSEDLRSESSEELKAGKSRRLTSRQRAMQGETVELEYTKLGSPKTKKKDVQQEDWDHDEEMELKRQQKARLRQMVSEKRNREKRAAMVDKVLRGVTSKRKKFTLATEARAAQVEVRLTQNEMRDGCLRYVSNKNGSSLSIPKDTVAPPYLSRSLKASYPPICKRDPKTGKRVFPNMSTLTVTE